MQIATQQKAARANAQHYEASCEFMGLFEADAFDEEVQTEARWWGLVRDERGVLQVHAEYVYDGTDDDRKDSGMGWWI